MTLPTKAATAVTRPDPLLPPEPDRADGRRRRVGLEIEFAGLPPADAARLVRYIFGGTVHPRDEHRFRIEGTLYGTFTVELDMLAAHPEGPDGDLPERTGPLEERFRAAVGDVGSLLMPYEISCPPVPVDEVDTLDALVEGLRRQGAMGTEGRLFYAFGLHFNPELARPEADPIIDVMKAYLLLSPWLREDMGIDIARRVAPFVHRFPEEYVALVVDPAYRPDLEGFARDYVRLNPTRNRELDLFPLLACLVPGALDGCGRDPRVKPRPTWHWRLPDSRVGQPGWSVVPDWNRWVQVERLASDRWALNELGALWLDCRRERALADWPRVVGRWLAPG